MNSRNRYLYWSIILVLLSCTGVFFDRFMAFGFAICLLLIAGNLIAAAVAVKDVRARAVGFLVPVMMLGTMIYVAGPKELKTSGAVLPHSKLIQHWVQQRIYASYGTNRRSSANVLNQKGAEQVLFANLLFAAATGVAGAAYGQYVYVASRRSSDE